MLENPPSFSHDFTLVYICLFFDTPELIVFSPERIHNDILLNRSRFHITVASSLPMSAPHNYSLQNNRCSFHITIAYRISEVSCTQKKHTGWSMSLPCDYSHRGTNVPSISLQPNLYRDFKLIQILSTFLQSALHTHHCPFTQPRHNTFHATTVW